MIRMVARGTIEEAVLSLHEEKRQHVGEISSPQVVALLEAAAASASASDLQRVVGLKDRVHFLESY
ncbi:MAG: hypothetical protein WCG85_25240, partial [Polyangia bacterium]